MWRLSFRTPVYKHIAEKEALRSKDAGHCSSAPLRENGGGAGPAAVPPCGKGAAPDKLAAPGGADAVMAGDNNDSQGVPAQHTANMNERCEDEAPPRAPLATSAAAAAAAAPRVVMHSSAGAEPPVRSDGPAVATPCMHVATGGAAPVATACGAHNRSVGAPATPVTVVIHDVTLHTTEPCSRVPGMCANTATRCVGCALSLAQAWSPLGW